MPSCMAPPAEYLSCNASPYAAQRPCSPPVASSSPSYLLPVAAEVLQTPEFVHSLPPSTGVHVASTEL